MTSLNSPLYDPKTKSSVSSTIVSFLSAGVPNEKIIMGIAFYAPTWTLQSKRDNKIGSRTIGTGNLTEVKIFPVFFFNFINLIKEIKFFFKSIKLNQTLSRFLKSVN